MAKGMYASISSTTKKIKKNYAVVGGVTKKIKKMYAIVANVTRLIFSGGQLKYYGAGTALSVARMYGGGASNSKYAIFAGGDSWETSVEAYNTSLTKSTAADLSNTKYNIKSASLSNCAIFLGGNDSRVSASTYYKTIEGYNTSLTKVTATANSPHVYGGVATINNYAIFCGGMTSSQSGNYVSEAYNSSLTKTDLANISDVDATGAFNKSYAIIATSNKDVDTFNSSLTKGTASKLLDSVSIATAGGTTAGDGAYALFACGRNSSGSAIATVVAYNTSLTRSLPTMLSVARYSMGTTSLGDYAIFGGGYGSSGVVKTVDAYDASLTRTTQTDLTDSKYALMAASVGDFALFAGGWQSNGGYTVSTYVNVYQLA